MDLSKNIQYIYRNDLKFNNKFGENDIFESDDVKSMYDSYKKKPKIELRLEDSKIENYSYLDLSKLDIDDEYLKELLKLDRIKNILKKIPMLDLSNNKISKYPDIKEYQNIIIINIDNNNIEQDIFEDNIIELCCSNNKIKSINSQSLIRLIASNNNIKSINIPKINMLIINNNELNDICSYLDLKYLECISNNIQQIDCMINLEELYVSNNKLNNICNMPKLKVLNCTSNPINKIKYFSELEILMSSTPNISSQYIIKNISKAKQDFIINFNTNE